MRSDLAAVAFDLDGTLYPNYRFNVKIIPFALLHAPLLLAFAGARTQIRREQEQGLCTSASFYVRQAEKMSLRLGKPPELIQKEVEQRIYRGWEPFFERVRLFPHVAEVLQAFRAAGLKLALLSDFPPEQKLKNLKLESFWDLYLCTEELGRLKPDPLPFRELSRCLDIPPQRILYVGNSPSYDAAGAKRAGMRAALVVPPYKPVSAAGRADFCFHDYRQLRDYVLN